MTRLQTCCRYPVAAEVSPFWPLVALVRASLFGSAEAVPAFGTPQSCCADSAMVEGDAE